MSRFTNNVRHFNLFRHGALSDAGPRLHRIRHTTSALALLLCCGTALIALPTSSAAAPARFARTTITSMVPGINTLTVAWTIKSSGGSAITRFMVTSTTSHGPVVGCGKLVDPKKSRGGSCTFRGLASNTVYEVSVAAVNAAGKGPVTTRSKRTKAGVTQAPSKASVPSAPTIASVIDSSAFLAITWTVGSNGGSPITGYVVSATPASGPAMPCLSMVDPAPTSGGSCTITGLTDGTTYTVSVAAVNAVGTGPAATQTSSTSSVSSTASIPGASSIVSLTPSNSSLSLIWTAGSNGGSPITGYVVSATPASGPAMPCLSMVDPAPTSGGSCTITGLTHGTSYTVSVAAVNAVGTGPAATQTTSTTLTASVPDRPVFTTVSAGDGSVALAWTGGSNGGSPITGYNVSATPASGPAIPCPSIVDPTPSSGGSCTITGLTDGTSYTVSVAAVNAVGTGPAATQSASPHAANAASLVLSRGWAPPGATVPGSGSGFAADSDVTIAFSLTSGLGASVQERDPALDAPRSSTGWASSPRDTMAETVTTDAEGDFTTSVPVPSSLTVSGDYDVTASGDNALNQSTSASTAILVGFDNTAPILTGFGSSQQMTVSPATFDGSTGPTQLTVTFSVTDDLSGAASSQVYMVDKFGGTSIGTVASMISGNTNDGVWQATITVPQYTGPQWFVSQVGLEDHAGNYVNYLSPGYSTDSFDFALSGLGYFGSDPSSSPSATNVGVSDTTPPAMASSGTPGALVLSSSVVDVTSQSQTIDVTVELTDDLSGIASATLNWLQASSGVALQTQLQPANLVSGNSTDGVYSATMTVPEGTVPGDYVLQEVLVQDAAGNYVQYLGPNFSNTLANTLSYTGDNDGIEVTNSTPLLTGPAIVAATSGGTFGVSPTTVDTSQSSASVTFQFQTTQDAASSMSNVVVWIINGNTQGTNEQMGQAASPASCDATAGTCTYDVTVTLPANAPSGPWYLDSVSLLEMPVGSSTQLFTQYDNFSLYPVGWDSGGAIDFSTLGFDPSNYTITDELSQ